MTVLVHTERPTSGVVVLRLDRPDKHNALNAELLTQLGDRLAEAGADEETRTIVLTGTDPAFCAGVDLAEISAGVRIPQQPVELLRNCPLPVIAAINGPAVTGGLELALAADFRIGSERASFKDTHTRIGFVPVWGMAIRLPETVGQAWARRISLTGEQVEAGTALRIGLLTEIVEHSRLIPRAVEIASAIAQTDRAASAQIRRMFDIARDDGVAAALEAERAMLARQVPAENGPPATPP